MKRALLNAKKTASTVLVIFFASLAATVLSCGAWYYGGSGGGGSGSGNPVNDGGTQNANDPGFFYFSYDDSASTVAPEMAAYQIDTNLLPSADLGRPWEFLNYEASEGGLKSPSAVTLGSSPFSVSAGLVKRGVSQNTWELGVSVIGPSAGNPRPKLVLTVVVDVSGSMDDASGIPGESTTSKLELTKSALSTLVDTLKPGDIVNFISFSDSAYVLMLNADMTSSIAKTNLKSKISDLVTIGGTDLEAGINAGYTAASSSRDITKTNRVLLITDAYANAGQTDATVISQGIGNNNAEGILFSGVGVGYNFNEAFLNELTEKGKGATMSLITRRDAKRVFDSRFNSLMFVAARDVRFRLDYPSGWIHQISGAEQVSTNANAVQTVNFSDDTNQYFFEAFSENNPQTGPDTRQVKLTITWKDQSDGSSKSVTYAKTVDQLLASSEGTRIDEARLLWMTAGLISEDLSPSRAGQILSDLYGSYTSGSSDIYNRWRPRIDKLMSMVSSGYSHSGYSFASYQSRGPQQSGKDGGPSMQIPIP